MDEESLRQLGEGIARYLASQQQTYQGEVPSGIELREDGVDWERMEHAVWESAEAGAEATAGLVGTLKSSVEDSLTFVSKEVGLGTTMPNLLGMNGVPDDVKSDWKETLSQMSDAKKAWHGIYLDIRTTPNITKQRFDDFREQELGLILDQYTASPDKEDDPPPAIVPDADAYDVEPITFGKVRGRLETSLYTWLGGSASIQGYLGFFKMGESSNGAENEMAAVPARAVRSYGGDTSGTAAGLDTGISAFAGLEAGGAITGALEWFNPDEEQQLRKQGKPTDQAWVAVAEVKGKVAGNLGLGFSANLAVGVVEGQLRVVAAARLVYGKGATGKVELKVNAKTITNFVGYVYHSLRDVGYSNLTFVEPEAFKILTSVLVRSLQEGVDLTKMASKEAIDKTEDWWQRQKHRLAEKSKRTEAAKGLARKILKDPRQFSLRTTTPEAKGRLLAILSDSRSLLERDVLSILKEGGEEVFGLLPFGVFMGDILEEAYEELEDGAGDREEAILHVLRWVQSPRELWEVCESMVLEDVFDEGEDGSHDEDDGRPPMTDGGVDVQIGGAAGAHPGGPARPPGGPTAGSGKMGAGGGMGGRRFRPG
ncbi:hypothetical protein BSZ35_04090 [Salinibacter sp. 10B]|uniref:hypothetical protein n=1 Tax=Salinibacter sp. 10B TaxID=1923971 RepID=UPI000CF4A85D|nr:hypothetical protein [Salinibacter sp. 10B]PQJ33890.1 hypothetical protein BSZ35_04090 [Salinibacter sp. 10B]